jgi:hypothetical protein
MGVTGPILIELWSVLKLEMAAIVRRRRTITKAQIVKDRTLSSR